MKNYFVSILTHLCEEIGAVRAVPEGVKKQDVRRRHAPQAVQRLAVERHAVFDTSC